MERLKELKIALVRLNDALAQSKNEFVRDAAIQRFEFCFELAWKTIQQYSRALGMDVATPRLAFAIALQNGWIDDEPAWVEMLRARNLTVHTYKQELAEEVYGRLHVFADLLRGLIGRLEECHLDT